MRLKGSEIVAEVLLEQGVDTVFGYPGGTALNIYDSLYKYSDRIKHILTSHEQGAAHAADGYSRASGRTGVVLATSGPGATNLVTGIATAFMDSIPMVAITVNVPDSLIGRDAFQEICITGVTLPVTKHNFFVNKIEELAPCLRKAFHIANSGRKGPVLVDITKDVTAEICEYTAETPLPPKELPIASDEEIAKIAELINASERPIIYFGGGVAACDGGEELAKLIEKADIAATYTMMAAGVLSYDDRHNLGLIGMHGSIAANKAVDRADLVLAFGTRFSDRVALNAKKFAHKATIIQVDIDKSEINKNVLVDLEVVSDVKYVIEKLLPLVEDAQNKEWAEQTSKWKKQYASCRTEGNGIKPQELIGKICDMTDENAIYATDVGQHQMWAAQYIKHIKNRSFITSGGLGTMGFGYGAAIGSQVACPKKRVIHITGDGSFHMNLNEAATAVSYNLPIITVIFNNRVLGMVYQWQTVFYDRRFSATTPERKTDFVKLAEGFGAVGFRADTIEEFETAMKKALKVKGPVWIECSIDREERVLPMIPNGGTIEDMIVG